MKRLPLSLPLAALAIAAGCGGSGGNPDADPAAIAPARAPVYVEASITSNKDVDAVAKKLFGTGNAGAELKRLFERAAGRDGSDIKWDRDFKPWIGNRIGIFVTSIDTGAQDADAALVAPTDDPDKAKEFLEKDLAQKGGGESKPPKVVERTYKDTKYKVDTANDEAVVIADNYAVVGTEQAVKGAIDAQGGEALADTDSFKKARDQVGASGVGFGYVKLSTLFSALGPQGAAARQLLGQSGDTLAFGLDADKDAIKATSAALGVKGPAGASGPGSVLATLPGDAWLAAGASDLGGMIDRQLQQLSQLGALGGVNLDQALEQVRSQTGIDVREDVIKWMGDVGVYVSGDQLASIGGALVIKSKDPAASERLIPRIGRLLRQAGQGVSVKALQPSGGVAFDRGIEVRAQGVPLPISVVSAGDRFVIAVGSGGKALETVLKPSQTLADSAEYKAAAGKLTDDIKPQLFVNVAPIRSLVDASGAVQGKDAEQFRKALDALTTIVAGAKRDGDVSHGSVVVGVK